MCSFLLSLPTGFLRLLRFPDSITVNMMCSFLEYTLMTAEISALFCLAQKPFNKYLWSE